jgi:hypothetical protein
MGKLFKAWLKCGMMWCFVQDGVTTRLNDFVELLNLPGEEGTRVACVEALWSDAGGPTGERQLGTFRIFYRPKVLCLLRKFFLCL